MINKFLKIILLITVIIIFLCSCSLLDVKIDQPYETPPQSLSASPVPSVGTSPEPVITNTSDPTMTSPPTSTPIATVVPTAEPLLTISDKEISDFITTLGIEYPPERIEMIYDGRAVLILYSKHDVYTIYELYKNHEYKLVSTEKRCSNYSYPLYRIIINDSVKELNLPYVVFKIYDWTIYENSVKTIIHGYDESIEVITDGEQLIICADENLKAVNYAESFNSNGDKIGEYYFNRSVIVQPDVVPPQKTIIMDSGTVVYAWGGGTSSLRYDLDGDGTIDEIDFAFPGFSDNSHKIFNTEDIDKALKEMRPLSKDSVGIRINGNEFSISGDYFQGLVIVVDIDSTDGRYELLIGEEGPSSDCFSTFVGYDGQQPYIMGVTGGTPDFNTLVDGSGYVTTHNRGHILHTWSYEAKYVIENGFLVEQIEDGLINMSSKVKLKADLPLQVSREDDTISYTVASGQDAVITWTDNEKWCFIETTDGNEGWFEVESFGTVKILGLWSGDVFEGLCMAD